MHAEHRKLLSELEAKAPAVVPAGTQNDSYFGSGHPYLFVSVPVRRRIAKDWATANRALAADEVLAVATSLIEGLTHEEKTLGCLLIAYRADARLAATPAYVNAWLEHLSGWAEIDTLCYSVFPPEDLLADWAAWGGLIAALARNGDINKRRASLVLLTRPVRPSDDPRLAQAALANVAALKAERHILITKAVSWLLRSMAPRHRKAVEALLEAEAASLAAIAVRETRTLLRTGVKSGRPRASA